MTTQFNLFFYCQIFPYRNIRQIGVGLFSPGLHNTGSSGFIAEIPSVLQASQRDASCLGFGLKKELSSSVKLIIPEISCQPPFRCLPLSFSLCLAFLFFPLISLSVHLHQRRTIKGTVLSLPSLVFPLHPSSCCFSSFSSWPRHQ